MDASEIEGHLQHHEWRFQDDQATCTMINMAPSGFAPVFVGWFDGETYFISHVFTCVGWSSTYMYIYIIKDLS